MPVQCIYVGASHDRCPCKTINPSKLCSRHAKADAELHTCFHEILTHHKHFLLEDLTDYVPILIGHAKETSSKLLRHAFSKESILAYAQSQSRSQSQSRVNKSMATIKIADLIIAHLFLLHRANEHMGCIVSMQKRWKAIYATRVKNLSGPYPNTPAINGEDPFTCEDLASISSDQIFSYIDGMGHCYAFMASHLLHSIREVGSFNPYTREEIPDHDIHRLERFVKANNIDMNIIDTEWRTPEDAFTDILYDYECFGFYTKLEWFSKLNLQQIYEIYFELSADRNIPLNMFSIDRLDTQISEHANRYGAHFCFAEDMKNLIKSNHPMKFYIVCNLFVVLSFVCPLLRHSLPRWVLTGAVLR